MQKQTYDLGSPESGMGAHLMSKNLALSDLGLSRFDKRNSQLEAPSLRIYKERRRNLSDAMAPYESPNLLNKELQRRLDHSRIHGSNVIKSISPTDDKFRSLHDRAERGKDNLSYSTLRRESEHRQYLENEVVLRTLNRNKVQMLGASGKRTYITELMDPNSIQSNAAHHLY